MARKRKTSPPEDSLDLVAMLPWWGGVLLALVSYLFLHAMAGRAPVAAIKPGDIGAMVVGSVVQMAATVGQFAVPAVCLLGALGSFLRRQRRSGLVNNVAQSRSADALDGMSWQEFELLVGEAFRLQGYDVTELGGDGPDGGVDLVLRKGSEKFLVQCKQWKAFKVGVTVVRELYGVMAAKGAVGGFVVTSGAFTEEAKEFASGRNIRLIDGLLLHGLLKQARTSARASPPSVRRDPAPTYTPARASATPACPSCGAAMLKRIAKKGGNAGSQFWGCSTYPACKGTRSA
ncbi:MAG: restriction endonuclease [Polaromonas sp.]|nr:restriction endonuclease [Polaromonas sp.]